MAFTELQTERLRLRAFAAGDLDQFCEFWTDPVTQEFYGNDYDRGRAWRSMATFLGHWQLHGFGMWALEDKASGLLAGHCGFWYPEGWDDIEIGYGIHPRFRGLGYAVEAAHEVRRHGYHDLGFPRLVSYINPANIRSIRVAEKLNAAPDGTFMMNNTPHTVYLHINTDQKE